MCVGVIILLPLFESPELEYYAPYSSIRAYKSARKISALAAQIAFFLKEKGEENLQRLTAHDGSNLNRLPY